MRLKLAAAALGISLAASAFAHADDLIRAGKWSFAVTAQSPAAPKTRPGGSPGNSAAETHTSCITASDPTAELRRPNDPMIAEARCGIQKLERVGGTASWETTCTMPDAVIHSEGTARFVGDRMEGSFKTGRIPVKGPPTLVASRVVGRYVGPCDSTQ